jgi:zinc transporter, ZIP family
MDFAAVVALSCAAGFSTLFGLVLGNQLKIEKRIVQFCLSASTGMMISVAMLGMLPKAAELGGVWYSSLGFILGGLVFMITATLFPHTYLDEKYEDRLYSILKTGSLVVAGIILYGLPAGLFVGSSSAATFALGAAAAAAIVIQGIPRGMAIDTQLSQTGMDARKKLFVTIFSAIVVVAVAIPVFFVLSGAIDVIVCTGLSFSAGAMLFVLVDQMMPLVKGGRRLHETAIALFLGLYIGMLLLGI